MLAPEHPLVEKLIKGNLEEEKCRLFIDEVLAQDEIDRLSTEAEKKKVSLQAAMTKKPSYWAKGSYLAW